MKHYLSTKQIARLWHISQRRVAQYCSEGRIPGTKKIGSSWLIPDDAAKPIDPRLKKRKGNVDHLRVDFLCLMPLMNSSFKPGEALLTVENMTSKPKRDIALAEYYYFTSQAEKASAITESYLVSDEAAIRLSALLIYAFSNLTLGHVYNSSLALGQINKMRSLATDTNSDFKSAVAFIAAASSILLHLPFDKELNNSNEIFSQLPFGLLSFAIYLKAHYLYLKQSYAQSIGMIEAALSYGAYKYPVPAIYLHLMACIDYINLKKQNNAKEHLLKAWDLARHDGLFEAFSEHHGLLGAMLEAVIKPKYPEDFKKIINTTYQFSSGWRRVHNPISGHDVAGDLTTTEFAIAMLATRGWTNQEIANHLKISINTVKSHLSEAMKKLNSYTRKDLKQFMLK